MTPQARSFQTAFIALTAIAVLASAEVSASTISLGGGEAGCARKCCTNSVETSCCCRSRPITDDALPQKTLPAVHFQSGTDSTIGLTCGCSLETPSAPADRESRATATAKTVGLDDLHSAAAGFEPTDPFRDAVRRAAHSELPTPKTPVYLRMARLRI